MLTTRKGTAVIGGLWVASWGLVFVNIGLATVSVLILSGFISFAMFALRTGCQCSVGKSKRGVYLLPITRNDERHNTRVKMLRKVDRLVNKKHRCEQLIQELEDPMKIAVLEAERDAAYREAERIRGDVKQLEAFWIEEDRERRYKELVG